MLVFIVSLYYDTGDRGFTSSVYWLGYGLGDHSLIAGWCMIWYFCERPHYESGNGAEKCRL